MEAIAEMGAAVLLRPAGVGLGRNLRPKACGALGLAALGGDDRGVDQRAGLEDQALGGKLPGRPQSRRSAGTTADRRAPPRAAGRTARRAAAAEAPSTSPAARRAGARFGRGAAAPTMPRAAPSRSPRRSPRAAGSPQGADRSTHPQSSAASRPSPKPPRPTATESPFTVIRYRLLQRSPPGEGFRRRRPCPANALSLKHLRPLWTGSGARS